jgi:hypothetical protein
MVVAPTRTNLTKPDSLLTIGATAALDRALVKRTDTLFTIAELQTEFRSTGLHLADAELAAELDRRVTARELHHPTADLYWCGAPTPFGAAPPSPDAVIDHVYGPNTGWGYGDISAANRLSLTTQVPSRATFAVPYDAGLELAGAKFVVTSHHTARIIAGLTITEITLLEALKATFWWESTPEQGITTLAAHINNGRLTIDTQRLLTGAATEDQPTQELLAQLLYLLE